MNSEALRPVDATFADATPAQPTPRRSRLLFGATLGNFLGVTAMVNIPLGIMLVPIAQDTGWSRTEVAGAFTALSLAQALAYPLAGRTADRFGPRPAVLYGSIGMALTLLLIAIAPSSLPLFYALFVLAGVAGVFASTMVLAKLLAQWFETRLGFWLGLVGGVGNGLGGMVMPGVTGLLVATLGWRHSFAAIAIVILLVGQPIYRATLRARPQSVASGEPRQSSGHSFGEAMRSPLYWIVFLAVPLGGGALTGVFASTVTILGSQGIATGAATLAVAAFALVCVINEPLVGHLLDGADRPRRIAPFYAIAVLGIVMIAHAHSPVIASIGAALTGMGLGAEFSVLPYLLARYFGLREMGAISGVAYAGALVGNGLSPLLLNAAFDRMSSYAPGLYLVAGLIAFAFVVFLLLPRFPDVRQSGQSGTAA